MKEQSQVDGNTITVEEMKNALERHIGAVTGNYVCQIAFLEKQNGNLAETIARLTANEARLVERIQDLETELASMPVPLSPELAKIATQGNEALAAAKAKANE